MESEPVLISRNLCYYFKTMWCQWFCEYESDKRSEVGRAVKKAFWGNCSAEVDRRIKAFIQVFILKMSCS